MTERNMFDRAESAYGKFKDPNLFHRIDEKIAEAEKKLSSFYDDFSLSHPNDPSHFLRKEKSLLLELERLKKEKQSYVSLYKKFINYFLKELDQTNYHQMYVDGETFYLRLNFEKDDLENPDRTYHIEVSTHPSREYEKIIFREERKGKKADDILR